MPDHGLFIAGIIRSLAPQATLHLYEVLNEHGIGDLETIAQALLRIHNDKTLRPLILNCSFHMGVPGNGHKDADFPEDWRNDPLLQYMGRSLPEIFQALTDEDVVVVAAAGNDAMHNNKQPGTRPDARYPANDPNVIGVGALKPGGNVPASYSNKCDQPLDHGYMTLGGEVDLGNGIRSDIGNSVLGVYIGGLPNYNANAHDHIGGYTNSSTGWAWWAGTSFAAAIISGTLAMRWGQPPQPTTLTASDAKDALALEATNAGLNTVDNEHVIFVRQG